MSGSTGKSGKVIESNEGAVREHRGKVVRGTVEKTLNAMLKAEAEHLINVAHYQRNNQRKGYRSGHYDRKLQTQAGDEVTLKIPKLRRITFKTAIIEC